jgi:hypothetical protein
MGLSAVGIRSVRNGCRRCADGCCREASSVYLHAVRHTAEALGALMVEINSSGRAMKVLAAMAVQALDFAHLSADRLGGDVQQWLDESMMAQDTTETERDQTELGGEG